MASATGARGVFFGVCSAGAALAFGVRAGAASAAAGVGAAAAAVSYTHLTLPTIYSV